VTVLSAFQSIFSLKGAYSLPQGLNQNDIKKALKMAFQPFLTLS
jgi:hypothetical protein